MSPKNSILHPFLDLRPLEGRFAIEEMIPVLLPLNGVLYLNESLPREWNNSNMCLGISRNFVVAVKQNLAGCLIAVDGV